PRISSILRRPRAPPRLPYTTLFRSELEPDRERDDDGDRPACAHRRPELHDLDHLDDRAVQRVVPARMLDLELLDLAPLVDPEERDRKSTRLNSSHVKISYAVFCLKK